MNKVNLNFNNEKILKELQKQLYQHLSNGELVNVTNLRKIGKTYTLIKKAKENNYIVVEPTKEQAKIIINTYYYNNVYAQDDELIRNKEIYVDEFVNIKKLKNKMNCKILGGYYIDTTNKQNYNNVSFNDNIVNFLKREEKSLREKADKMLRREDFAMYTKIVHSYETVIELIKKYDWQLKYSEYKLNDKNGQKQIAIWEQNGDGQIRKHKIWNVENKNFQNNDTVKYIITEENIIKEITDIILNNKNYDDKKIRQKIIKLYNIKIEDVTIKNQEDVLELISKTLNKIIRYKLKKRFNHFKTIGRYDIAVFKKYAEKNGEIKIQSFPLGFTNNYTIKSKTDEILDFLDGTEQFDIILLIQELVKLILKHIDSEINKLNKEIINSSDENICICTNRYYPTMLSCNSINISVKLGIRIIEK